MDEMYIFEEHANIVIEDMKEFINLESQIVLKEHDLDERLMSLDLVFQHLDEIIPEDMTHLHKFNAQITDLLVEISALLKHHELSDLNIEKEEKKELEKLSVDIKHRGWRAVKKDVGVEERDEKTSVRVDMRELLKLHTKFNVLRKLIKESHLKSAIEKDTKDPKQIDDFERKEEYYLIQIYKVINFYENLFKGLVEKERILFRKIKNES